MTEILHDAIPGDLAPHAALPGVQPLTDGRWLRVDEAYGGQMALRRRLLAERRAEVLWQEAAAAPAVAELFAAALELLPDLGFAVGGGVIRCPDGRAFGLEADLPLAVLGQVVQEDLCLMEKRGEEHVLTAAVLCFPSRWTLAEKAGRPLTRIHRTVPAYDAGIARRVQRLFDGVQPGRPLWRNNMLRHDDPALFQPGREGQVDGFGPPGGDKPFLRAERQCILRLPRTQAVVFSIHTYVARNREGGTVSGA